MDLIYFPPRTLFTLKKLLPNSKKRNDKEEGIANFPKVCEKAKSFKGKKKYLCKEKFEENLLR